MERSINVWRVFFPWKHLIFAITPLLFAHLWSGTSQNVALRFSIVTSLGLVYSLSRVSAKSRVLGFSDARAKSALSLLISAAIFSFGLMLSMIFLDAYPTYISFNDIILYGGGSFAILGILALFYWASAGRMLLSIAGVVALEYSLQPNIFDSLFRSVPPIAMMYSIPIGIFCWTAFLFVFPRYIRERKVWTGLNSPENLLLFSRASRTDLKNLTLLFARFATYCAIVIGTFPPLWPIVIASSARWFVGKKARTNAHISNAEKWTKSLRAASSASLFAFLLVPTLFVIVFVFGKLGFEGSSLSKMHLPYSAILVAEVCILVFVHVLSANFIQHQTQKRISFFSMLIVSFVIFFSMYSSTSSIQSFWVLVIWVITSFGLLLFEYRSPHTKMRSSGIHTTIEVLLLVFLPIVGANQIWSAASAYIRVPYARLFEIGPDADLSFPPSHNEYDKQIDQELYILSYEHFWNDTNSFDIDIKDVQIDGKQARSFRAKHKTLEATIVVHEFKNPTTCQDVGHKMNAFIKNKKYKTGSAFATLSNLGFGVVGMNFSSMLESTENKPTPEQWTNVKHCQLSIENVEKTDFHYLAIAWYGQPTLVDAHLFGKDAEKIITSYNWLAKFLHQDGFEPSVFPMAEKSNVRWRIWARDQQSNR